MLDNPYKKLTACAAFSLSMCFNAQANFDRFESAHITLDLTTAEHSYNGVSGLYAKSTYLGGLLLDVKERYDQQMNDPVKRKEMQAWFSDIEYMRKLPRNELLETLDEYVNDIIEYQADEDSVAQKKEYFFTPYETLKNSAGDCEDYAILKYFLLRYLGIDDHDMRITHLSRHSNLLVLGEEGEQYFLDNSSWISFDTPKEFYPEREYYIDGPVALLNFSVEGLELMKSYEIKGMHSYETRDPWGWEELIYGALALEFMCVAGAAVSWVRRRRSKEEGLVTEGREAHSNTKMRP